MHCREWASLAPGPRAQGSAASRPAELARALHRGLVCRHSGWSLLAALASRPHACDPGWLMCRAGRRSSGGRQAAPGGERAPGAGHLRGPVSAPAWRPGCLPVCLPACLLRPGHLGWGEVKTSRAHLNPGEGHSNLKMPRILRRLAHCTAPHLGSSGSSEPATRPSTATCLAECRSHLIPCSKPCTPIACPKP